MTTHGAPVDLGAGLTLRTATDADVDGIVAVETDAFGPPDGPGVLAAIEEAGGPANWTVVTDPASDRPGRIVSASALLDHTLDVAGCAVPAGQVEWVATAPGHQRRGLVRAQFDRHHRLAAERGHLVLLIAGIPYLYRRFGYGYGLEDPALFLVDADQVRSAAGRSGRTVRMAVEGDIDALQAMEAERPVDGVHIRRERPFWLRQLAAQRGERAEFEQLLVAVDGDRPTGWLHVKHEITASADNRFFVEPGVTLDAASTDALIARAIELAEPHGSVVVVFDTPGTVHGVRVRELGRPIPDFPGYYVRTPDPVGLVTALAPALTARLAASERYADRSGSLEISLYREGLAIDLDAGAVSGVRAIAGVEDPMEHSGVGVAPDWFGALVLGRWGASALAERADDVLLGRHARLMDVLFPRLACDLATDL